MSRAPIDDVIMKARARRSIPAPVTRRLLREQAGLTQHDIAAALGVTRAAVSRWELGERNPRGDALDAYIVLLDRLRREVLA